MMAGLGVIGYGLNGRFWILGSQLGFAGQTADRPNVFHLEILHWIAEAYWLVFPLLACATLLVRSAMTKRWEPGAGLRNRRGPVLLIQVNLLIAVAALFALHASEKFAFVQSWYYVSYLLMPASFLSLGMSWYAMLDRLDDGTYRLLSGSLWTGMVASTAIPVAASDFGSWGAAATMGAVALAVGGALISTYSSPQRLSAAMFVVVIVGLNFLCRHEFQMKTGVPAELTGHHPVASQSFDSVLPQCFRMISDYMTVVSRHAPAADVWLWYDKHEPCEPVFRAAACTHLWFLRWVNSEFPRLPQSVTPATPGFRPGDKIAVLSQDARSTERALQSLSAGDVAVRILGEYEVGSPPVACRLTMFEVERAVAEQAPGVERTARQSGPATPVR
jgi:hypothetical protein